MNDKLCCIRLAGLIAAVALLAACGSAPSNPTVTVSDNGCAYSGPKPLPSAFTITWAIKETNPPAEYNFLVITLEDGKTGADLEPYMNNPDADTPGWMNMIRHASMVTATQSQDVDLTENGAYHGQPIYIVCIDRHGVPMDFVGPLDVKQE